MRRILYLALATSTLWGSVANASPEMPCHNAVEVAKQLSEKYDEAPVAFGVQSNGNLLQVYATEDKDTWTVVTTTPAGVSCIVAAGKSWNTIPFGMVDPTASLDGGAVVLAHQTAGRGDVVVDYRGWRQNNGASCCGSGECRPTRWRFNPDTRQEEILVGETWREIDERRVIGVQPADGGAHICTAGGSTEPGVHIRCIVKPGFGA